MNGVEILITVTIAALCTVLTRALPFLIYRGEQPVPDFVIWIGQRLPRAVMMLLIIYCLKDMDFQNTASFAAPFLGIAVTAILHLRYRKMMISICAGTLAYMLLIRIA